MGKRKLHDKTYYQCDWTALPMDSPACYMPSFDGKKLKKRGNYCNWESVVAHANHLHQTLALLALRPASAHDAPRSCQLLSPSLHKPSCTRTQVAA